LLLSTYILKIDAVYQLVTIKSLFLHLRPVPIAIGKYRKLSLCRNVYFST